MKPLKVEFNLATPVSGMSLPLHLDALLAYAVTQDTLQSLPDETNLGKSSIRILGENLPLEKSTIGDLWCWKASALMADETISHEMRLWTRKTETETIALLADERRISGMRIPDEMKPNSMKIDTASGKLKSCFQFIPVRTVKKFTAYCIGDKDKVFELLQNHITHIGARGRSGFGRIAEENNGTIQAITVEECYQANELWEMRVMPWSKDGYIPMQAAHKAPYWANENKALSYIPQSILM